MISESRFGSTQGNPGSWHPFFWYDLGGSFCQYPLCGWTYDSWHIHLLAQMIVLITCFNGISGDFIFGRWRSEFIVSRLLLSWQFLLCWPGVLMDSTVTGRIKSWWRGNLTMVWRLRTYTDENLLRNYYSLYRSFCRDLGCWWLWWPGIINENVFECRTSIKQECDSSHLSNFLDDLGESVW